jgi:hypothetical protein
VDTIGAVMPKQGYAVVSCHVERLLDDRVYAAYSALVAARPGGFRIASLVRPPDDTEQGRADVWAARVAELAALGPVGHHTHWGGPTQARPTGGDPGARVRAEAAAFAAAGVAARFFCGGAWYFDAGVAAAAADLGYVDCSATAYRPPYLAEGAPRVQVPAPTRLVLEDGRRLLELPATHSIGMLVRAALAPGLPAGVHVYFHDWDAVDARRRTALRAGLRVLSLRRRPLTLAELADTAGADAPELAFAAAVQS